MCGLRIHTRLPVPPSRTDMDSYEQTLNFSICAMPWEAQEPGTQGAIGACLNISLKGGRKF